MSDETASVRRRAVVTKKPIARALPLSDRECNAVVALKEALGGSLTARHRKTIAGEVEYRVTDVPSAGRANWVQKAEDTCRALQQQELVGNWSVESLGNEVAVKFLQPDEVTPPVSHAWVFSFVISLVLLVGTVVTTRW